MFLLPCIKILQKFLTYAEKKIEPMNHTKTLTHAKSFDQCKNIFNLCNSRHNILSHLTHATQAKVLLAKKNPDLDKQSEEIIFGCKIKRLTRAL